MPRDSVCVRVLDGVEVVCDVVNSLGRCVVVDGYDSRDERGRVVVTIELREHELQGMADRIPVALAVSEALGLFSDYRNGPRGVGCNGWACTTCGFRHHPGMRVVANDAQGARCNACGTWARGDVDAQAPWVKGSGS